MKGVDTIARVRRAFYVQGWSMKKIARELHVSRNTVRKILRSDETKFSYERTRQPLPRIGPWQEQIEQFLSSNAGKPSRERLTLIRIFEEMRALGYEGGYDAIRRFAKTWSQGRGTATAEAYVPLYYEPGEAYQFDWSHEVVIIAGATVTVKVAHVRLCHSRMMFARAYMRESQEMVFDAHDRAFAFFRGACGGGLYREGAALQSSFLADVQSLFGPARGLHASIGLGERASREPSWVGAGALLYPSASGQEPGRAERLADRQMRGLCQGASPSRAVGQDRMGDVRGGAAKARSLCWPL